MRKYSEISYGEYKENLLDLYLPESDGFDLFIYFHGGGLEMGSRKDNGLIFEYLAEKGIATASVDYRMFPTAKYPDFIEDCAKSVAWIKENISKYGNCNRIFIGGSSAGGYLSMMLCFDSRWLSAYGLCAMDFDGFIHDAGQPTNHFNILGKSGIDSRRIIVDETAPLYHIGVEENYPPMLFIVSDNDMQNRYEQTMLTISTLKHFGHSGDKVKLNVCHGGHCHYLGQADQNGNSVFGQMVYDFIK